MLIIFYINKNNPLSIKLIKRQKLLLKILIMSMFNSNSSMQRHTLSSNQKRQILWNIIEPGDPYDIKRSMIAKMPGDRHNFMGQHLEIVCLFQAAEIERLSEYLQQFKLKCRQIERKQLDRHSYEIQIKELTQQLNEQNSFRTENLKLREFLKKQTGELDELKKQQFHGSGVEKRYQDSLREIQTMYQQIERMKIEKNRLLSQNQHLTARISALQSAKQRQLQELRYALTSQSQANFERQKREFSFKFESQVNRLEYQVKRLKQINDTKNKQINELINRNKMIQSQLEQENRKHSQYSILQKNIQEYESRFGILSIEIERLNQVLRKKANECEQLQAKCRKSDDQLLYKSREAEEFKARFQTSESRLTEISSHLTETQYKLQKLDESQMTIRRYEERIQVLSREIDKLNALIRKKVQENEASELKMSEMEYEMKKTDLIRRQNEELKRYVNENYELKRSVAELESKMLMIAGEVQRLNFVLKGKQEDLRSWGIKYQNLQNEAEALRSKSMSLQRQINQEYRLKISQYQRQIELLSRDNQSYKRKLADLGDQSIKVSQYENKIALLSQQIQRLSSSRTSEIEQLRRKLYQVNETVQRKQTEIQTLKTQLNNSEYRLSQQYKSKLISLQLRIKKQNDDNNELRNKLLELTNISYKINEYENKMIFYNQEIDRLNDKNRQKGKEIQSLQMKVNVMENQNQSLKRNNTDYQYKINNIKKEYENQISSFQFSIRQSKEQNQELNRKLIELGDNNRKFTEYENRITMLSNEIERLNSVLKVKVEENNGLENKNRMLTQESQGFQREIRSIEQRISMEYQSKISIYESRVRQSNLENEELRRRAEEMIELSIKVGEYESRISSTNMEFERVDRLLKSKTKQFESAESRIRSLEQENSDMRRKLQQSADIQRTIAEYENRAAFLTQEIERLNSVLRAKMEQNNDLANKVKGQRQELEALRRNQGETEYKVVNEYKTRITTYETRIQQYTSENEDLRRRVQQLLDSNRRIVDYQTKITQLSQQIERLNGVLRGKVDEANGLENKLRVARQENDDLRRKAGESFETRKQIESYQSRILGMSAEIQRLNGALRSQATQLENKLRGSQQQNYTLKRAVEDFQSHSVSYQSHIRQLNEDNSNLRRKLVEYTQKNQIVFEHQTKIIALSKQIDRLSNLLKSKNEQFINLQMRTKKNQQQYEALRRSKADWQYRINRMSQQLNYQKSKAEQLLDQKNQLNRRLRQFGDANRKFTEYENRITMLSNEIERLNSVLKVKVEENNGLENKNRMLTQESQGFQREIRSIEQRISMEYQSKISIYESRVRQSNLENEELRRRAEEMIELSIKVGEYESRISSTNMEFERVDRLLKSKTKQFESAESRIRSLEQENSDMRRKLQQSADIQRTIAEYENRAAFLTQEIERLNSVLRAKMEQNNDLANKVKGQRQELEALRRNQGETEYKVVNEYKTRITTYETRIQQYTSENEDLRRRVQQLLDSNRRIVDYQTKITQLSQQIERLNGVLRGKVDEANGLENKLRVARQENDDLRRKAGESFETRKQIESYQSRILGMSAEIQRLNGALRSQAEDINFRMPEYNNKITVLSRQIERLNASLRTQIEQIHNLQQKISKLVQENDNLRNSTNTIEYKITKQFQLNLQQLHQQNRIIINENQTLKKQLQLNNNLNNKIIEYQSRIAILTQQYQTKLTQLRKQNEQYYRNNVELTNKSGRIMQYENKITLISQQIQRLNQVLREKTAEMQDFHFKDRKYLGEIQRLNNALRLKVQESQQFDQTHNELLSRIAMLENDNIKKTNDINIANNNLNMLSTEYETCKKHLGDYELSFRKVHEEFERLQTILQELKKQNYQLKVELREYDSLVDKNRVLSAEIDRLTQVMESQKQQISDLRLRYADQACLQKRINEHMALMVILFAEIQSLRQRVKDKQKQVEDVRRSSLMPYKV